MSPPIHPSLHSSPALQSSVYQQTVSMFYPLFIPFGGDCSKPLNTLTRLQTNISVFSNLPVKSQLRSWVALTRGGVMYSLWRDHDLAAAQLCCDTMESWWRFGHVTVLFCNFSVSLIILDVFLHFNVLFLSVVFSCVVCGAENMWKNF